MRAMTNRIRTAAVLAVAGVVLGACGGGGTQEIAVDGADELDGPLPTAPDGSPRNTGDGGIDPFSGDVDVNDLIRRIDGLNSENDLCTLLTGEAMADVTTADINLASLASNPAGFSQLFASLDRLFGHMVKIGPEDLKPPLTALQGVWGGMSDIDIRGADAEARASALLSSEDTKAANDALGAWVAVSCEIG